MVSLHVIDDLLNKSYPKCLRLTAINESKKPESATDNVAKISFASSCL